MSLKLIKTKKNTTMAFGNFVDSTSRQDIVIFPNMYEKIQSILKEGNIYLLGIRVQNDRFDSSKKQYVLTNLRVVNYK